MALLRFGADPWREFNRQLRDMNELVSAFSSSRRGAADPLWSGARLFPLLNVRQIENAYVVTAEIPGIKTEDLEIKIEGDTLTLKGERRPYETGEGASYHRRERATGTFQRSLTLPAKVDSEAVTANYKDGVLTITLQKEKAAIPKQITVTTE